MNFRFVHPDLLMLVVLTWSFLAGFKNTMVWAFLGGLILDALTAAPFGVFSAGILIISALAGFWYDRISSTSLLLPILLALPYSIVFNLSGLLFLQVMGRPITGAGALERIIFPAGLIDVLAMAFIFPLFLWLNRRMQNRELTL